LADLASSSAERVKMIWSWLVLSILADVDSAPVVPDDGGGHLSRAVGRMSRRMYEAIRDGSQDNIVVSPFSVHTGVSMLAHGAEGRTLDQLAAVLGFVEMSSLGPGDVLPNRRDLLLSYRDKKNMLDSDIEIANSLFADDSFSIKDDYQNLVRNFFLSQVRSVDFEDNLSSVESINSWVANKTNNLIQSLLTPDNVDSTTRMVLINAIYFKAKWLNQFKTEDTKTALFHSPSSSKEARFMSIKTNLRTGSISQLNATVVSLPYEDPNFSMLILLPNEDSDIEELQDNMASQNIDDIIDQLQLSPTKLSLPKFKIGYETSLKDTFKAMGAGRVFSKQAELGLISDESHLGVEDILHKAQVEVTEEGSEAAAATGIVVGIRLAEQPRVVNVNRPFMFVIYDSLNDIPLFMGKISDPTEGSRPGTMRTADAEDEEVTEVAEKLVAAPEKDDDDMNKSGQSALETVDADESAVHFSDDPQPQIEELINPSESDDSANDDEEMDAEERAHVRNVGPEKVEDSRDCTVVSGNDPSDITFPCPQIGDTEPIRNYIEEHGDGSIYGHNGELADLNPKLGEVEKRTGLEDTQSEEVD